MSAPLQVGSSSDCAATYPDLQDRSQVHEGAARNNDGPQRPHLYRLYKFYRDTGLPVGLAYGFALTDFAAGKDVPEWAR